MNTENHGRTLRAAEWVLAAGVFTGWAVLTFRGIAQLGQIALGLPERTSYLLPLTVDCLTALAFLRHGRLGEIRSLVVAVYAAGVSVAALGASYAFAQGYATPGLLAVVLVSAIPTVSGVVALHLLARGRAESTEPQESIEEEPWESVPVSAAGGTEPTPDPAAPSPASPPPSSTPDPAPAPASGATASAGNGGRSAASGSAAAASSPTTNTAPGATPQLPGRALTDPEIAALIRDRRWQDQPTKQLGNLLRDEGVRVGQKRVGPLRDLARTLNGATPQG